MHAAMSASDLDLIVHDWLADFDKALGARDLEGIASLFLPDGFWRDLAGFAWDIRTVHGAQEVARTMIQLTAASLPTQFVIEEGTAASLSERPEPWRASVDCFFVFDGSVIRGRGYLKLVADTAGRWRAWTVLTTADEIKGIAERSGAYRPMGTLHHVGRTWLEQRQFEIEYTDRDPDVLVLGSGHSGLSIAARLGALQLDALVIERNERVGDNWRLRYRSLNLHNEVWGNHLPYLPFPSTWPVFCSKDQMANWLEAYSTALDINVWTSTVLESAEYLAEAGRWTVVLRRGADQRTLHPRHLVLAIGVFGRARTVELHGAERFNGAIITSQQYQAGSGAAGERVLVIGTGSSGHDIAQDYCEGGAEVTMLQRGSTCVLSAQPSSSLAYALYREDGPATEDADLMAASTPIPLTAELHRELSKKMAVLDADLLAGLARAGFHTDYGHDGSGFLMKYYRQGGGYYINVGASDLIAAGRIKVLNGAEVAELRDHEVIFTDGRSVAADTIVLAVGFENAQESIRELLGDLVAERVGPIWGLRDDGEVRGLYSPTGQPNLWIMGGSLVQCRLMSKVLALQIKARQAGIAG